MPQLAGDPSGRSSRGGNHLTRPRGNLALGHTQHITFMRSGKTRVSSTWTRCSTSPAATSAVTGPRPLHRPRLQRTRTPRGPTGRSSLAGWSGPLSDRGEPSDGGPDAASPPRQPPGARRRQPLRPGPLPDRGSYPRAPPAAATSRSRSCVPSGNAGWRPWCVPAARRISARWNGPAISRSRPRSSQPAAFSTTMGSAALFMGGSRADGRPAKPDLCSDWPAKKQGLHPGLRLRPRTRQRLGQ